MKHFKRIVLAAFAVVIAGATLLPSQSVQAQSSASLSIAPKKNYTIEPGKSVDDTLVVKNLDAEETLNLSINVVDFTYTNDTGAPKLFLAENAPQTTWSLKPFLTVPKTVSIPPKSSETLDISVAIPANRGAGSYYSAIVYSSGSADGGNVGLSASGVTLVFTSVPGEVKENLKLDKFGAYRNATKDREAGYMNFMMNEPQMLAYTLKNEGNVTESPVGSITLKHMFGSEQVISDVNPNSSLALIGQTRTFTSCIKLKAEEVDFNGTRSESTTCTNPGLWPGFYSATLNLYYGQNGNHTKEINGTTYFWYLPLWFIALVVVVLAIIAYFVWRIVRRVKAGSHGVKLKKQPSRRKK